MMIFVDTSALFAILSADDENHLKAKEVWLDLLTRDEELVTMFVEKLQDLTDPESPMFYFPDGTPLLKLVPAEDLPKSPITFFPQVITVQNT